MMTAAALGAFCLAVAAAWDIARRRTELAKPRDISRPAHDELRQKLEAWEQRVGTHNDALGKQHDVLVDQERRLTKLEEEFKRITSNESLARALPQRRIVR